MPDSEVGNTSGKSIERSTWLWVAALAITLFSGLEPTWSRISKAAEGFQNINATRQDTEKNALLRLRSFEAQKRTIDSLEAFENKHPIPKRKEAKNLLINEFVRASQAVPRSTTHKGDTQHKDITPANEVDLLCNPESKLEQLPPTPKPTTRHLDPKNKVDEARNNLIAFCQAEAALRHTTLEKRKKQLEEEKIALGAETQKVKNAQDKARTSSADIVSNIDFELLGVKFKAPAILAPALWCVFSLALLWSLWKIDHGFALDINQNRESTPEGAQFQATRMTVLGLSALIWLAQLRVAWIGLDLLQYRGNNHIKSLVALLLILLLLATVTVIVRILRRDRFVSGAAVVHRLQQMLRPRPKLYVILAWMAVLGSMALIFLQFRWTLQGAHVLQQLLVWLIPVPWLLNFQFSNPRIAASASTVHTAPSQAAATQVKRRSLIGISVAAVLLAGAVAWNRSSSHRRPFAKWFTHHKRKPRPHRVNLELGFYSSGHVYHYVSHRGQISKRARFPILSNSIAIQIPPSSLPWPGDEDEAEDPAVRQFDSSLPPRDEGAGAVALNKAPDTNISASRPSHELPRHVCLATASWAFENAALDILSGKRIGRKDIQAACDLLLDGIKHDQTFKRRQSSLRKRSAPSYRLHDLLAGVCIRYQQQSRFDELLRRIDESGQGLLFQSRLDKWQDITSPWRARWRNRAVPIRWNNGWRTVVF